MTSLIKQHHLVDGILTLLQLLVVTAYFRYVAHYLQHIEFLGFKIYDFDLLG